MSTTTWRAPPAVIARLLSAPQQFGFFQALRLLEQWVGLERLQFRSSLSLSFPGSEIEALQVRWRSSETGGATVGAGQLSAERVQGIDLTPACMGLLGVSGALPLFYTEWLSQAEATGRHGGSHDGARAFLEVFSHRSVSLFYQAWCKHRMGVRHEQRVSGMQAMAPEVLALAGLGLTGLRHRLGAAQGGVADEALAYFAGALQQRTLSVVQLQRLLAHQLGVPLRIEPFVGRWYPVPRAGQTALGGVDGGSGTGRSAGRGILGRSALLGARVWQRNLCVRLVIGPLAHQAFLRFLPGGTGVRALRHWLTLLLGTALEVEVRVGLHQGAVQGLALRSDRSPRVGRLGWDTFVLTGDSRADRLDVHHDIRLGEPEPAATPASSPFPGSLGAPAMPFTTAPPSPINDLALACAPCPTPSNC